MIAAAIQRRIATLLVMASGMLFAPGLVAQAVAVDFNLAPRAYTADTTALTITGPGRNDVGVDQGGVAVFSFDSVSIPAGATITVRGSRPLKLVSSGSLTLSGVIDANGTDSVNYTPVATAGGPGGGGGGPDFSRPGDGPGGGGAPSNANNGGGGGGFGGPGAGGGVMDLDPGTAGAGGEAYGDLNARLQAGSGGGGASAGGSAVAGGGGGGAIALFGHAVSVTASGVVSADGGSGAVGDNGAAGGGSGGGIIVHGDTVNVAGTLSARGGDGGAGDSGGDGGGGGGGHIAYQYRTLLGSGTADVAGGDSGVADVANPGNTGCSPNCGPGGPSPDATGAEGTVTTTPAPAATTTAATPVAATSAVINATINPNGNATSYRFDYGTTSAYGSRIPVPADAPAGADATARAVSEALVGLAPVTTYHYRVVATSALGFVTTGTDAQFTTLGTDADADGVRVPQDCDDRNAAIRPGGRDVPGNGIDEDCSGSDELARVATPVSARWNPFKKHTTVGRLVLRNVPKAATVIVTCSGKGCPLKSKKLTFESARKSYSLTSLFNKKKKGSKKRTVAKLRVRAKVEIDILVPKRIGKYVSYTIRAGKSPTRDTGCLVPGGTVKRKC
jgi:hypothetical protein